MTLTLKLAQQSFRMTLQLMMMHHHTKFNYKRLSGSEDVVWTKYQHTDGHTDSNIYNIPLLNFVTGDGVV